jgi:hypothetical protein
MVTRRYSERESNPHTVASPVRPRQQLSEAMPDAIELECAGCTLTIEDGEWQHDRACIFRPRPAGAG